MILALFVLLIILVYTIHNVFYESKPEEVSDRLVIEGYKLYITPKVTTRLKALKCRNTLFETERETEELDLRIDEAIAIAVTLSWKEKSSEMSHHGRWSDIGIIDEEESEKYYCFLESFRTIIEDESMTPPEKVKRVQSMEDPDHFLPRLYSKYGMTFPENLFLDQLRQIEGVSDEIARQLYSLGFFDFKEVAKMDQQLLMAIKEISENRMNKYMHNLRRNAGKVQKDTSYYCSDLPYTRLVQKNLIIDLLKRQIDQVYLQIEEFER